MIPHLSAPDALVRVFEPAVLQGQNTGCCITEKFHVNPGLRCAGETGYLPDISDLIGADDATQTVDDCLKRFAPIEIKAETLLGHRIEDEVQAPGMRRLQPGFDVFGYAEGVENSSGVCFEAE